MLFDYHILGTVEDTDILEKNNETRTIIICVAKDGKNKDDREKKIIGYYLFAKNPNKKKTVVVDKKDNPFKDGLFFHLLYEEFIVGYVKTLFDNIRKGFNLGIECAYI